MPVLATADRVQTPTDRSPANTLEGPGPVRWSQGAPVGQLPPQMSHPMPGPVAPSMMPPPGTMIAPNGQLIASGPMPPPHLHRSMSQPMGHPMEHPMGRHPSFIGQPEYKIFELNRRLHQQTEDSDNLWWEAFTNEFFEDDATLSLVFNLEDGLKRYTIGRTLIPRYFRSIFEGGVTEMQVGLKHSKDLLHGQHTISLESDNASIITQHGKPYYTKVISEGRMVLEFVFDEAMRIRTWHFTTKNHREMLPRTAIAIQDASMAEQLSKNITRQGLTNYTLNFLRLCVILEPMQELMSRHKAYGLTPRDCLKTTLFQKWQRMVAPPETARQPNKRRKRKSNTPSTSTNTPPGMKQKRSPMQCAPMMPGMPCGANPTGGVPDTAPATPTPTGAPSTAAPTTPLPLSGTSQMMAGFAGAGGMPHPSHPLGDGGGGGMSAGGMLDTMGPVVGFGDVMVVGEPTLMGGEYGDEDERVITRLENGGQMDPVGPATALMGGPQVGAGGMACLSGVGVMGPAGPGGVGLAGLTGALGPGTGAAGVGVSMLPPLMGPASLLSEQHPNLGIEDDIKDPKLKSGEFPCPSSIGICADPLDNLSSDQWSSVSNKIGEDNCTSDITDITIKTE